MAGGLSSKEEALVVIKLFREKVQGTDRPAESKDSDAVIAAQKEADALISRFLALFQDIPDEL